MEKKYKCVLCFKELSNKSNLTAHMKRHTGEKPFKCESCGKRFTRSFTLRNHMKQFHQDSFSRNYNTKILKCSTSLECHKKQHHKGFQCQLCSKKFVHEANLRIHHRTHTGEYPFKCVICGNCFNLKETLTRHLRTHTGEKPYKCKFCDKRFKHQWYARGHLKKKHPSEFIIEKVKKKCSKDNYKSFYVKAAKPSKCYNPSEEAVTFDSSGQSLPGVVDVQEQPQALTIPQDNSHVQIGFMTLRNENTSVQIDHDGGDDASKSNQCGISIRELSSKSSLTVHMKRHTGEKPFKCYYCGKRVTRGSTLRNHIKRYHQHQESFSCNHCTKTFKYSTSLDWHKKLHHKELDDVSKSNQDFNINLEASIDSISKHDFLDAN